MMLVDCAAGRAEIFVPVVIFLDVLLSTGGLIRLAYRSPTELVGRWLLGPGLWVSLALRLCLKASLAFMWHPGVLLLALTDTIAF